MTLLVPTTVIGECLQKIYFNSDLINRSVQILACFPKLLINQLNAAVDIKNIRLINTMTQI